MARWLLFFPQLFLLFLGLSLYCIFYYLIYPGGFFLTVWVIRDSITTWSARCDSSVTAKILLLIVGAISAAFYNCLRWSRSREPCVKHGIIWLCNRLHKCKREPIELAAEVVLLKTKESISGGWISLRRSIPQEEEIVLGIFWILLSGESLGWLFLLISSGDSDSVEHVSQF